MKCQQDLPLAWGARARAKSEITHMRLLAALVDGGMRRAHGRRCAGVARIWRCHDETAMICRSASLGVWCALRRLQVVYNCAHDCAVGVSASSVGVEHTSYACNAVMKESGEQTANEQRPAGHSISGFGRKYEL